MEGSGHGLVLDSILYLPGGTAEYRKSCQPGQLVSRKCFKFGGLPNDAVQSSKESVLLKLKGQCQGLFQSTILTGG